MMMTFPSTHVVNYTWVLITENAECGGTQPTLVISAELCGRKNQKVAVLCSTSSIAYHKNKIL